MMLDKNYQLIKVCIIASIWNVAVLGDTYELQTQYCIRYKDEKLESGARTEVECALNCRGNEDICNGFVYESSSHELGRCFMYPYVENSGDNSCLGERVFIKHLSEVLSNLAVGQLAIASSSRPDSGGKNFRAIKGVDGKMPTTLSFFGTENFASTGLEEDPWYQVELNRPYNIDSVKVWSRADSTCCTAILQNLEITVSMNMESYGLCAYTETAFWVGEARLVPCTKLVSGQYVRVQKLTNGSLDYLEILEFEVYGF